MQLLSSRRIVTLALLLATLVGGGVPRAWSKGKNAALLYGVTVGGGVERALVAKVHVQKNTLVFDSSNFKKKFKPLSVLLVVDEADGGVLAELVVGKRHAERQQVVAKILRLAPQLSIRQLQGKTIVRLEDVSSRASEATKLRANALVQLAVGVFSRTATAAHVMPGVRLDPMVRGLSVQLELFAPRLAGSDWLNWWGVRARGEQLNEARFASRGRRSAANQQARLQGESSQAEVILRPWRSEGWLHQLTLSYSFLNHASERVAFTGNESAPDAALLKLERRQPAWGASLSLNPCGEVYLGLAYRAASPSVFTVSDSLVPAERYEGRWGTTAVQGSLQLIHALANTWRLTMLVTIERRVDDIVNYSNESVVSEFHAVDLSPALVLGVGFAS